MTTLHSGGDRFATDVQSGFSEYVSTEFEFGGSRNKRHWLRGPRGVPITDATRMFSGKART